MNHDQKLPHVPSNWQNDRAHFFKYMSANVAKIVLANRTLRWSTPKTLNDPYDMQFSLAMEVDRNRLREKALARLWELYKCPIPKTNTSLNPLGKSIVFLARYVPTMSREEFDSELGPGVEEGLHIMMKRLPELNAQLATLMKTNKVLCLTIDPTNPAMWAYYANSNKGVVLRFRSIPAFDSVFGVAKPVRYVESVPNFIDQESLTLIFAGHGKINPDAILDMIVWTKGLDWQHEKEWRISSGDGRDRNADHEDILFNRHELDGVIFGENIDAADKADIIELASRYPNVTVMEARKSPNSFKHEIVSVAL